MRIAMMLLLISAGVGAAPTTGPEKQAAIVRKVDSSLVIVDLWLTYSNGQEPVPVRTSTLKSVNLISQKRPLSYAGFLIAPNVVLTHDLPVDSRFIKKIEVRQGQSTVEARIDSYALDENAIFLRLSSPIKGATPLQFSSSPGSYLGVDYDVTDEIRNVRIGPVSFAVARDNRGLDYIAVPNGYLVVDSIGRAVGIAMNGELPLDSTWKRSPEQWAKVSQKDRDAALAQLKGRIDSTLLRVELGFRSPRSQSDRALRFYDAYDDEEGKGSPKTEARALGVALSPKRVLVLIDLKPEATARLERIRIFDSAKKPREASFVASLSDYGAFVAEVAGLRDTLTISQSDVVHHAYKFIYRAQVHVAGNERIARFGSARCIEYDAGFRGVLGPCFFDDESNSFLFDRQGSLVALPLPVRNWEEDDPNVRWRAFASREPKLLVPALQVKALLGNLSRFADSANIPLPEEREGRLAWLGVVLQGLDAELARINGVSDQTKQGETGALISYVYPNSPAALAGVKPGMVFLRIRAEKRPKPYIIQVDRYSKRTGDFEMMDERAFDMFMDNMPPPWPGLADEHTRYLTSLGVGAKFEADFVDKGKVVTKSFVVSQSPPHFDIAPRFRTESLGLTLRNLTFEVRRYYQKSDKDPGVIISKVDPGSKASVAGIVPYEIITHVNGVPVSSVQDFEKQIKGKEEVRLTLNLMYRTRQLSINLGQ